MTFAILFLYYTLRAQFLNINYLKVRLDKLGNICTA